MVSGCGGGPQQEVKATPIQITNANGLTATAAALSIGSKLNLSMMPSGDTINGGVDWTVICGGNPVSGSIANGACGTLLPAHTADGAPTVFTAPSLAPIGASVTITATVTSNPAQASNVSLTILSSPIAVAFASSIPNTMVISTTASLSASTTNDPLGKGTIWTATCGAVGCGSFNPTTTNGGQTTFTAPASVPPGGTVTVTATSLTDTTKSVSATIAITGPPPPPPPPAPIAISVLPANIYVQNVGASRSATVVAIVSNDSASAGVDWTVSCSTSNCGTISSHTASGATATFQNSSNVPVGGTITVTAKSTSDPTKSAMATANVVASQPIAVKITTPPPAKLNTATQATLVATASPGTDGVNWTATCGSAGACGTFNLSPAHTANNGPIIYMAPATSPDGSVVTITASSAATTPSDPAFSTTTIIQAPPPPPSLSFASAPPASLVGSASVPVSVAVANDLAPGGVTWTAQCGSATPGGCGWFAPTQTASGATAIYTAPPVTSSGTSVTLVATSIAAPSVSISSNPIAINPDTTIAVNFIPSLPSQMQADTTINLNAAVTNDPTHAGVEWQVCPSGCGFFTIKPAMPAIEQTNTTPYIPPVPAVTTTTVSAWPDGLPIPYTAPSQAPSIGTVAVVVSAHADATKANSGTVAISSVSAGPALNGSVRSGAQPVTGATVSLYAAGTDGYGSLSAQIATATPTDKNGNFTVSARYTCPQPTSQMYLVATGGTVVEDGPNPNLALMTALGNCSNLSSTPVVLNEVTTVASAYATSPFSANDALTGNSSYLYLGSSNSNLTGLANAFAAVNNLVDITTGKVRFLVPSTNAAVPYVEINTLADILNACTASAGGVEGDGSSCSTLFTAADVLSLNGNHSTYTGSVAPADTLQAAFNIAQHPVSNYGYQLDLNRNLFQLASTSSPYQPILTAGPNDWSVSLQYTGGGGLSSSSAVGSFALDAVGNLWITDTKAGSVIEWNAVGAALSPSTGFPAGGGPIAIDANGDVWISGNGVLSELTNLGTALPWSPFGGVPGGGGDAAIDAENNLWINNPGGVYEFNNLGMQISPANGFVNNGVTGIAALGIDSANNIWVGNAANSPPSASFAELSNPGGQLVVNTSPQNGSQVMPQIAADAVGDIWAIRSGNGAGNTGLCMVPPYDGRGSTLLPTCYAEGALQGQPNPSLNIFNPAGVALDGAGTVWVASQGGGTGTLIAPGVFPFAPSLTTTVVNTLPYTASSIAAGSLRVAIDGSGNIWVLLADNTVTEYVGAATPAVTPLALGLKNKKLGAKP